MPRPNTRPTRLGVITDTHVGDELSSIPREALRLFGDTDLIVHAGDVCQPSALEVLREIAPVVAVRGNHDPPDCGLPQTAVIEIGGVTIGVIHGERPAAVEMGSAALLLATGGLRLDAHCRALLRKLPDVDCVLFGHLHIPIRRWVDGVLFFSPGAAYQPEGDPNFDWSSRGRRVYRAVRQRLPPNYLTPAVGLVEIEAAEIRAHAVRLKEPLRTGTVTAAR